MLTIEQVRKIHAIKQDLSHEYIKKFDEKWEIRVRRIKNSRINLSQIQIVPEEGQEEK